MPRYRMTVRFNAFKNRFESHGGKSSVQNERRVITKEEASQLVCAKPGTILAKEFGASPKNPMSVLQPESDRDARSGCIWRSFRSITN